MKTETVHALFALAGLLATAALQDVLPAAAGVKPPLVVCFALYAACAASWPAALLTAFAGGCLVDALGALPFACTAGFLAAAAPAVRLVGRRSGLGAELFTLLAAVLVAPLFETWLTLWGLDAARAPLAVRFLAAAALALPAAGATVLAVPFLARHAGAQYEDEEEDDA